MTTKPQNDETNIQPEIDALEKKELCDEQLASIAAGSREMVATASHPSTAELRRDASATQVVTGRYH